MYFTYYSHKLLRSLAKQNRSHSLSFRCSFCTVPMWMQRIRTRKRWQDDARCTERKVQQKEMVCVCVCASCKIFACGVRYAVACRLKHIVFKWATSYAFHSVNRNSSFRATWAITRKLFTLASNTNWDMNQCIKANTHCMRRPRRRIWDEEKKTHTIETHIWIWLVQEKNEWILQVRSECTQTKRNDGDDDDDDVNGLVILWRCDVKRCSCIT